MALANAMRKLSIGRASDEMLIRNIGIRATALHLAAAGRGGQASLNFVELLLSMGANINARTNAHTSALQVAAWEGDRNLKMTNLLLANGAQACSHSLMQAEGWRTRELLLQHGAEPMPQRRLARPGATDEDVLWWWHDDHTRPPWFNVQRLQGWADVYSNQAV
eukprot:SAG31_NODE_14105_length_827_cov_0.910714_2_plen_164_part_00